MQISEVAKRVGIRASAIRYYERIGLLPAPSRISGRRFYEPDVLKAAQGRLQELRALRARLTLMEDMLNAVKLCRCGTVQACVNRLQKVGAFTGSQWGEKEGQVAGQVG
jgi:DNA-binding transcriptional MerR regulator